MKKLFLLMAALCCLAGAWAQYLETPQILETNTTQYMAPSVLNWKYSITQQIYTAAELDMPQCDIHGISFYHNNTDTGGVPRHVKIYLGTTTKRNFADSTFVGLTSSMKLVYTGDINVDAVTGWVPIEFDTDFEYSGVSNLVLCVVDTTGSFNINNNAKFDANNSAGIHTIRRFSDTEALTLNSDGTVTGEGGFTSRSISMQNDTTTSNSQSYGFELELVVTLGNVKAGAGFGYNHTNETSHTVSETHEVSAQVNGLPSANDAEHPMFRWNFVWYKESLNGQEFPVIQYMVKR